MHTATASTFGILDHLIEGCQIISHDWRYLYLNDAALRHARRPRAAVIGRTMMDVYPGIERTSMFETLRKCLETGTTANLESEFTYPDESRAWFELRVQVVPEGLFVLSLDISARKRSEQHLHHHIERLQSLRAIDLAILGTTDAQIPLDIVLHETAQRLDASVAAIFLATPGSKESHSVASLGTAIATFGAPTEPVDRDLLRRAAVQRRTVRIADTGDDAGGLSQALTAAGVRWACATPLVAKNRLVGVLMVGGRTLFNPDAEWVAFFEMLAGQAAMAVDVGQASERLQRSHVDLALAYDTTIEGWSNALDLRDWGTASHSARVADITVALGRRAGIPEDELVHVRRGALLHDIGKIAVPDAILMKRGRLTPKEWAVMREHPTKAYQLLSPIQYLRPALDIPWCHHEKWDGSGYPRQLRGEAIPLAARLFAVVDVWDALGSDRPYRKRWNESRVRSHLRTIAGTHLDPQAVDLFIAMDL